jgi:spore coat protein JC
MGGGKTIMYKYVKILPYPLNIRRKDLKMAKYIITQFGGANGELGAALRYFSQKFHMPDDKGKSLLNDIATEELGHAEMISTMVKMLIKDASPEELKEAGLDSYYTEHGKGIYPIDSSGVPFTASYFASTGDVFADLSEDMAAEQKARATYEKLIDLCRDNPEVIDPLRYLREREVVHFQRFGEALRGVQDKLAQKKFYMNEMNCKK